MKGNKKLSRFGESGKVRLILLRALTTSPEWGKKKGEKK